MADQQSLSVRGFKLASILDKKHGELELVLKVMDLENQLAAAREELLATSQKLNAACDEQEIETHIEIEEFVQGANDDRLSSPPDEKTWIETLSRKTGLDVRAILHTDLPAYIGRFTFRIAYKKDEAMHVAILPNVWVVCAND